MKWSIGRKIGSGFGLALVVLVIVGAVAYDSTTKLIDSAEWVRHTHEVLNGADNTLSSLKDAETGQRGYLITGEESYLEPYQGSRELVDQELKRLRELTSDNPVHQPRLNPLNLWFEPGLPHSNRLLNFGGREGPRRQRRKFLR